MEEKEILNKKIVDELMQVKGETRGFNIVHDADFILKEKGEEALRKIEEELEKVGCPFKYRELKNMNFYPAGLRAISLLAIKKTLNFTDDDIRRMSAFLPKIALVIKFFTRYFSSIEKALQQASKIWKKYWTVGELVVKEYNLEKKYAILELRNFNLHPIFCRAMEGYLEGIGMLVLGKENITCREKECFFHGGTKHQFLINWGTK